jgi:hypothetical protein
MKRNLGDLEKVTSHLVEKPVSLFGFRPVFLFLATVDRRGEFLV